MTSGGAEALKAAIRRSLFLIVLLVLLGVVSVNAFKQLRGPRYQASARVLVSPTNLIQIITNTAPSFVDATRVEATARALAGSPEVYIKAEERTGHPAARKATAAAKRAAAGEELALRLRRAVWRKTGLDSANVLSCGDLLLDMANYKVFVSEQPVSLTFKGVGKRPVRESIIEPATPRSSAVPSAGKGRPPRPDAPLDPQPAPQA